MPLERRHRQPTCPHADRMPRSRSVPAVAILLTAGATLAWLVTARPDRGDVAIYRWGARAAAAGRTVYGVDVDHHGHGFSYPPFAALAMGGLARLPTPTMWACLVAVSCGALLVVLRLCVADLGQAARSARSAAAVGVLVVAEPVTSTLRFGQVDMLLCALVLLDLLVLRRGVLIGIATAVKLTPGLFIVFLLLRRRRGEVGGAVTSAALCTAAGALAFPRASLAYWGGGVVRGTGVGRLTTSGNQSIRGVAERALGAPVGVWVWMVLAVPVAALGLTLADRCADLGLEVLAAGAVGVTACLVSPVSWPHHWVWLVPALCGLWTICRDDPRAARALQAVAALAAVSSFLPIKAVGLGYLPIALVLGMVTQARTRRPAHTGTPQYQLTASPPVISRAAWPGSNG